MRRALVIWLVGLALSVVWLAAANLIGIDPFDRGWLAGALSGTASAFAANCLAQWVTARSERRQQREQASAWRGQR